MSSRNAMLLGRTADGTIVRLSEEVRGGSEAARLADTEDTMLTVIRYQSEGTPLVAVWVEDFGEAGTAEQWFATQHASPKKE